MERARGRDPPRRHSRALADLISSFPNRIFRQGDCLDCVPAVKTSERPETEIYVIRLKLAHGSLPKLGFPSSVQLLSRLEQSVADTPCQVVDELAHFRRRRKCAVFISPPSLTWRDEVTRDVLPGQTQRSRHVRSIRDYSHTVDVLDQHTGHPNPCPS